MLEFKWLRAFGMMVALASLGCEGGRRVEVEVGLGAGGTKDVQCGEAFRLQGIEGVKLGHAKLFVHEVEVWSPGQEKWLGVTLQGEGTGWQTQGVALLDLDTERCAGADSVRSPGFRGLAPDGAWTKLRFKVGVPFALNHADPTKAASPLDFMPMHWGWQAGYKFVRLELDVPEGGRWEWHLGSVECKGEVGAITGCGRPNRLEVEVPRTGRAERLKVRLDLEVLLRGIRLQGAQGCMSNAGEAECETLVKNFGEAIGAY